MSENEASQLTWEAYHPVSLGHSSNKFLRCCFPKAPCILVLLSHLGEVGIQLCRLPVIVLDGLPAICSEAVLEEGIYLDGASDVVGGT